MLAKRVVLLFVPMVMGNLADAQAVSCASVTRGNKTTCTATGGAHYTAWQFLGADGNVVTRSAIDSSTWSGSAVISGGVQVVVTTSAGTQTTVQGTLVVNPRSGFTSSPTSAALETNGYTCKDSTGKALETLTVPSPPTPQNTEIGEFCNVDQWSETPAQISDSGPNNGYFYVKAVTVLPQFHWTYTPDLVNTSSAFYKAQCGNFNASANTGYISGAQLKSNAIGHESGLVNGHYGEWNAAYQQAVTNPGTELEGYAQLSGSSANFNSYVGNEMQAVTGTIHSEVTTEPCSGLVTNDPTQSCKNDGPVNYANAGVYASCQ